MFLSEESLAAMAFDHKYASSGISLLDGLFMQKFWNYAVTQLPLKHDPKATIHWCAASTHTHAPCPAHAVQARYAAPARRQIPRVCTAGPCLCHCRARACAPRARACAGRPRRQSAAGASRDHRRGHCSAQ